MEKIALFFKSFSLLNDKRGNIWIGEGMGGNDKPTNGVAIIDPANELIKTMKTSDGLSSNLILKKYFRTNGDKFGLQLPPA